jgi:adenylate kinase family enzyme
VTDRAGGRLPVLLRGAVVGVTGSGKTTLARELARRFDVPHIELDALYWGADWTPRPDEVFLALADVALRGEAWTVDGNYGKVRDLVWRRANVLVWLDYALPVILWQLTKRIWRRGLTHEELWNGNREQVWPHFFTRDSLYWWALKTYGRRRREYATLPQRPEYAHLQVVRLRTPQETARWLEKLTNDEGIE